jgi:hypothetical protein
LLVGCAWALQRVAVAVVIVMVVEWR